MRHHTERPFTVEVKSKKKRFPQFFADIQRSAVKVHSEDARGTLSEIKSASGSTAFENDFLSDHKFKRLDGGVSVIR